MEIQDAKGNWSHLHVPDNLSSVVFLNNQSYAGGQDLWQHDKGVRAPCRSPAVIIPHSTTRVQLASCLPSTGHGAPLGRSLHEVGAQRRVPHV